MGVFNKTIIPLALVGYEMIIANSALRAWLAIYHLISNAPPWNNCFINPFAPGDFSEKRVLKIVEWFSGHCRAIKS